MHDGFENEIKSQIVTHQDTHQDTKQDKILEFCKEPHSKKIMEYMKYMEYKHTRNFTILYLKPLLESGLLQMTIPEKPNHQNQNMQNLRLECLK